ncbi:replication initiator protein A [Butyrivibrio sp. INlla14]|uniref:replication initiator protein A n=1 Tax=Butyrivibrio sp. INlla14 TaxID=1520808 RepID=UPI000875F67D|nr:replication initiator protein A [Butyrivibrio sp. INlla14]SCY13500.1 Replication initiator protein A (RepA) N-terminus [Butyrivibrio sp. INlla14]
MRFDYFYGKEADMMTFYRIPKLLITDPYFEDLDNEAKLMYGLLLDRMSLSTKNGWYDNQHRVYIIYGQKKLMQDLHRGRNKVYDMLNALEKIGLIEREKDRKYNPDKIYVKMFVDQAAERRPRKIAVSETQTLEKKNNIIRITGPSMKKSELCENDMFEMQTSEASPVFENQTYEAAPCTDSKHDMFDSQTYACTEDKHAHVCNPNTNYTEINKTDYSYTESYPICAENEMGEDEGCANYREIVSQNIETERLCRDYPNDEEKIRGLESLIVDIVTSSRDSMVIGSEERDMDDVRERFLGLKRFHIEDVIANWDKLTKVPKNPRAYLLAMLYNSPTTADAQIKAQVNHDMAYCSRNNETINYDELEELLLEN